MIVFRRAEVHRQLIRGRRPGPVVHHHPREEVRREERAEHHPRCDEEVDPEQPGVRASFGSLRADVRHARVRERS